MKKIIDLYKKYEEIINYVIVGGLTTLVSLITYYVCVLTILNPEDALELQVANIISWIISVSFAYIANRILVFKSKNTNIIKEIVTFESDIYPYNITKKGNLYEVELKQNISELYNEKGKLVLSRKDALKKETKED